MNILLISLKIFKQILSSKKSLQSCLTSIKSEYNLNKNKYSILVKTLHGTFRQFYLLSYLSKEVFNEFKTFDDENILICLATYQLRFLKTNISTINVLQEFNEASSILELRLDESSIDKLKHLADMKIFLPNDILNNTYKYNSLMFSSPYWLLKLMGSEYGDDILLNIIHSNRTRHPLYIYTNNLKDSSNYFDKSIYTKTDLENCYLLNSPIINDNVELKNGLCFIEDYSSIYALDKLFIPKGSNILALNPLNSSIPSNLAIKLKELGGHLTTNYKGELSFRKAKYQFSRLSLNNVKTYFADVDLLRTYLPYDSFDIVCLNPPSTLLGLVNKRPEILISLKKEDINLYVRKQKELLIEADKYLHKNGTIIYMVNSNLLEETSKVIEEFLSYHMEYTLKDSKQIFSYEYNCDGMYFAILNKGE